MRTYGWAWAVFVLLLLAKPTWAQQFGSPLGTPSMMPSSGSSAPAFMTQTLARPSYLAFMSRPTFPAPLNLARMMPTFPNLQNTMLLRNIFGTPPLQVLPPPKKK